MIIVFLAPIHDYTDLPFRLLCQRYGAQGACVPLVSAEAIVRSTSSTGLIDAHHDEKGIGVQLVGKDPEILGKAAGVVADIFPFVRWLNINCGCPSSRTRECGGGSELLRQPSRIAQAVDEMKVSSGKPVSVKIRIVNGLVGTAALCQALESAGADSIIIHARTPAQGYSGKADWELIKAVKRSLYIPIIGNGDIITASQGRELVENGYCDAFMVGRAAMGNPLLFCGRKPQGLKERFALMREYISLHETYLGEVPLHDAKLKALSFLSSAHNASAMRNRVCRAKSVEAILRLEETA